MGFFETYADVKTNLTVIVIIVIGIVLCIAGYNLYTQLDADGNDQKQSAYVCFGIALFLFLIAYLLKSFEGSLGHEGKSIYGGLQFFQNVRRRR